jgi:ubiquinone biosynthesis monooxygenase Coq7
MHTQNHIIYDDIGDIYNDTIQKKQIDILNLLPIKATRERLKTQMLRVDHAGEFGAVHIYRGQLSIFKNVAKHQDTVSQIQSMQSQEEIHLKKFNDVLPDKRIRPSALTPLWHLGGFFMGAVTAFISDKSAMACTEAVETVIDTHYESQINYFTQEKNVDVLIDDLKQFQQDELEHKHTAIHHDSHHAPFYTATKALIETVCHVVIKIAHKV